MDSTSEQFVLARGRGAEPKSCNDAAVSADAPVERLRNLIDARFEHDSCGVGFVASVGAAASHDILQKALTALARLEHRGATAVDGKTSDGVGVTAAIPRALLLAEKGIQLEDSARLGVGMVFIPAEENRAEEVLDRCLTSQDLKVLAWRDVPLQRDCLGEIALNTMPKIRQVLVADASTIEPETMERRLYLARKQFERMHEQGSVKGYICSLSSQTIVYKAMCTGSLLADFYKAGIETSFQNTLGEDLRLVDLIS